MLYAVSSTRLEFCVYFFCHMKDDGSGVLKALCLRDFPGRKTLLRPRAAWPSRALMRSLLKVSLFKGAASKRGYF